MSEKHKSKRTGTIFRYVPAKPGERCSTSDGTRPLFHLNSVLERPKTARTGLAMLGPLCAAMAVCVACQNDLGSVKVSATAERCAEAETQIAKVRLNARCYVTEGQMLMAQAELPDRTAWVIQCTLPTSTCIVVNLRWQRADRGQPLESGDVFAWTDKETVARSGESFTIHSDQRKTFSIDLAADTFTAWESEKKGVLVHCPPR